METDTLIQDVLAFLPDWEIKKDTYTDPDKNRKSYLEPFLDKDEVKDQLYVSKHVTEKEVEDEFQLTNEFFLVYTHRYHLPYEPAIYMALCKYTAGSLYGKYNLKYEKKYHGDKLCSDALKLIDPYVKVESYDVSYGDYRHICNIKRLRDDSNIHLSYINDSQLFNPHMFPNHHHPPETPLHAKKRPHHVPHGHRNGHKYIEPYVLVQTYTPNYNVTIETYDKEPFQVVLTTHKCKRKCKCLKY